ncbi:hypothetical protein ACLOJK_018772 [Asimina triloba]
MGDGRLDRGYKTEHRWVGRLGGDLAEKMEVGHLVVNGTGGWADGGGAWPLDLNPSNAGLVEDALVPDARDGGGWGWPCAGLLQIIGCEGAGAAGVEDGGQLQAWMLMVLSIMDAGGGDVIIAAAIEVAVDGEDKVEDTGACRPGCSTAGWAPR